MRWIAQLLVVVSLVAGALAASSAYHVPLDLPDAQLEGLTLNDRAGVKIAEDGSLEPLLEKNHLLTRSDLAVLRENRLTIDGRRLQVRFVRVKEFSFTRWRAKWTFLLSLVGMATGAVLTRRVGRRELAGKAEADASATPQYAVRAIVRTLDEACTQLGTFEDAPGRLRLVLATADRLQKNELSAFVDARGRLIARFGLGRAAELMDRVAATERAINRAWSAAADQHAPEAVGCLQLARQLAGEALATLDELEARS